jgi:hypothetical protein
MAVFDHTTATQAEPCSAMHIYVALGWKRNHMLQTSSTLQSTLLLAGGMHQVLCSHSAVRHPAASCHLLLQC